MHYAVKPTSVFTFSTVERLVPDFSKSDSKTLSEMTDMRRAVIKTADMTQEMQQDAIDVATTALSKFGIEKDVAAYIKKEFDKKYHPTWHVIVG